jgi:hypothetical protein
MNKKVVIARYKEPIDWINNLSCDYIIYNKGDKIDESLNHIDVPNEGREAETYLRFIVDNYKII